MSPRLHSITPRKLARYLLAQGFVLDHVHGSHYIYRHPHDGRRVVLPFHTKDIPRGTLHTILRQAGIGLDEFN